MEAVGCLFSTVRNEVKEVGNLKLADTMRRVAFGESLVDCESFDFIGHLFSALASESALKPLVGSDIFKMVTEQLGLAIRSSSQDLTFHLTATLLVINEWLKVQTLTQDQLAEEFLQTQRLLPEGFGPSESDQEYLRDLITFVPKIRDQLSRISEVIKENKLQWISEFEVAISDLFAKADSELASLEPKQAPANLME